MLLVAILIIWLNNSAQPGDLIAGLDLDDPSAVKKAVPFEGSFPPLGPPTAVAAKVHQRCAVADGAARMVLAGYEHPIETVRCPYMQSLLIHFERNWEARNVYGML